MAVLKAVKTCEVCGKAYNARMLGEDQVQFPACECLYKIRMEKDAVRERERRFVIAEQLSPLYVRVFGGAACADETFAVAAAADIKAAESLITSPPPHKVIIRSLNELKTKEVCVCMSRKLIAEGYSVIPIDVHQVLAEEDWSDLYKAEVVILHKLDYLPLGSKEQDRIFTLVDNRRQKDNRITWATTSKLDEAELPLIWGKELIKLLVDDCVFIQI